MRYIVNGTPMTRDEFAKKVLETVLDLGPEKAPPIAYRPLYTVKQVVDRYACKIARSMGWEVEVIR